MKKQLNHWLGTVSLAIITFLFPQISRAADANFHVVRSFGILEQETGNYPVAGLLVASNGLIYGSALTGGTNGRGVLFQMQTNGSNYQVLHTFASGTDDGAYPYGPLIQATDGLIYGVTQRGGSNDAGTIFRIQTDGLGYQITHFFNGTQGSEPQGGVVQSRVDGFLYGTTVVGGNNGYGGTLFKISPDGSSFSVLHNFDNTTGEGPISGVLEGADGYLYFSTIAMGPAYNGALVKIDRNGNNLQVLHAFSNQGGDGGWQEGRLIQGADNYIYGVTKNGGNDGGYASSFGTGTIFKIFPNGVDYQILYSFPSNGIAGKTPVGGLQFGPDGFLYGAAYVGGSTNVGTLYKLSTTGSGFAVLFDFKGSNGASPGTSLLREGNSLYGATIYGGAYGSGTAFKISYDGNNFATLHDFSSPSGGDGTGPQSVLSVYSNILYGTTPSGGMGGYGTVFSMNLDGGNYQILHSFHSDGTDGTQINVPVIKATNGVLYGTATGGGNNNAGILFKMNTDGSNYSILHQFGSDSADGNSPQSGLLQASDGKFYGTTSYGGTNYSGNLFRINADGSGYTNLYTFGQPNDGRQPNGELIQTPVGKLVGVTYAGGSNDLGTIFSISTDGNGYQILHHFTGKYYNNTGGGGDGEGGEGEDAAFGVLDLAPGTDDGSQPQAGLLLASDGELYGTTYGGGSNSSGTLYSLETTGANYKVMYQFTGDVDGGNPSARFAQGRDGLLYSTCSYGGTNSDGIIFRIGTDGTGFAVAHPFEDADCQYPAGGLAIATNGMLYGVAQYGGNQGFGAVYSFVAKAELLKLTYSAGSPLLDFISGSYSQNYQVQVSSNLVDWTTLTMRATDTNGSFHYIDPGAIGAPRRFYRTLGP